MSEVTIEHVDPIAMPCDKPRRKQGTVLVLPVWQ